MRISGIIFVAGCNYLLAARSLCGAGVHKAKRLLLSRTEDGALAQQGALVGGAALAGLRASLAVDAAAELNRGVEAGVAGLRAPIRSAINDEAGADLQRAL
jgi:hypothetical protein